MNRERLLRVATALWESPHAELFTMTRYAIWGRPCDALGHYASRPDLQSEFKLSRLFDRMYTTSGKRIYWYSPEVLEHFGLTRDEAEHLFSGDGCNDAQLPQDAASYVERYLAGDSDLTRTVRLYNLPTRQAQVTSMVLGPHARCSET